MVGPDHFWLWVKCCRLIWKQRFYLLLKCSGIKIIFRYGCKIRIHKQVQELWKTYFLIMIGRIFFNCFWPLLRSNGFCGCLCRKSVQVHGQDTNSIKWWFLSETKITKLVNNITHWEACCVLSLHLVYINIFSVYFLLHLFDLHEKIHFSLCASLHVFKSTRKYSYLMATRNYYF